MKNIAPLNGDDFRSAKRISGLLRGYEHKDFKPHHRHIPPDFNADLFLSFEGMYVLLKLRGHVCLVEATVQVPGFTRGLYLILKTEDGFMCTIEAGQRGQVTTMDTPYEITEVRAC